MHKAETGPFTILFLKKKINRYTKTPKQFRGSSKNNLLILGIVDAKADWFFTWLVPRKTDGVVPQFGTGD